MTIDILDMDQISLAKAIASKFHAHQMYGNMPYIHHLVSVARSVGTAYPNDDRLVAVAWLHDILEDTPCTAEVLCALFDDDVVAAVKAMTKQGNETRHEYLVRLRTNPIAVKVKIHDALCNLTESVWRCDMKRVAKYGETLKILAT